MNETEVGEWFKLLQGGGNVAIMALVFIASRVAKRFLDALDKIVATHQANHEENTGNVERIERAIIARDPKAAAIFDGT